MVGARMDFLVKYEVMVEGFRFRRISEHSITVNAIDLRDAETQAKAHNKRLRPRSYFSLVSIEKV